MTDLRKKRIAELIEPLKVTPGRKVTLARQFDPAYKAGFLDKEESQDLLARGVDLLSEYQEKLAAQDTYGVLVVLQALDAAGKDGTIRHVMSGVNPQGVSVHSFKQPSAEDLDHDYLWRYQRELPRRGEIGIFNRSYYEEVLVVRVHSEVLAHEKLPRKARGRGIWRRRYREINDWEHYLTDNGIKVVKLFLNLSKEEQRSRFLRRIDLPDHNWKFSASDVKERSYWDDYQKAFSEMLSATSTEWAPWHVIPADHKWFARICASAIIADALIKIDPRFPKVSDEARAALQETKMLLEAEAPDGADPDPFAAEAVEDDRHDEIAAHGGGKHGKKGRKKAGRKKKK
jgi:PPK2 family polyphosphate:nucleotide phosphotransferase